MIQNIKYQVGMQPKTPKKILSPNNVKQKKVQLKKPQSNIKNNQTKFIRQTQTKQTFKKTIKTPLIIPQLNLKTLTPTNSQNQKESKKLLTRVQTFQTKDPLTSFRNSIQSFPAIQTQINIHPSTPHLHDNSPMHTLLKTNMSKSQSDSLNSSTQKEELLLLQIKQLKRQNTFLKKKVRDLKKQMNGGYLPEQYQQSLFATKQESSLKMKKKGAPKLNSQSLHLTVNLFFQEIRNLLNSVTQLFRVQLTEQQVKRFQQYHDENEVIDGLSEDICPLRKHEILRKYFLNKKLERLALQQDDKKYQLLLGIFTEYYTLKEESEKKVVETIDSMIMYMNDLNTWLIEKAYSKKMKSEIRTQRKSEREFIDSISPPKFDSLKVPVNVVNYVNKVRGHTLSPMPRSKITD